MRSVLPAWKAWVDTVDRSKLKPIAPTPMAPIGRSKCTETVVPGDVVDRVPRAVARTFPAGAPTAARPNPAAMPCRTARRDRSGSCLLPGASRETTTRMVSHRASARSRGASGRRKGDQPPGQGATISVVEGLDAGVGDQCCVGHPPTKLRGEPSIAKPA